MALRGVTIPFCIFSFLSAPPFLLAPPNFPYPPFGLPRCSRNSGVYSLLFFLISPARFNHLATAGFPFLRPGFRLSSLPPRSLNFSWVSLTFRAFWVKFPPCLRPFDDFYVFLVQHLVCFLVFYFWFVYFFFTTKLSFFFFSFCFFFFSLNHCHRNIGNFWLSHF